MCTKYKAKLDHDSENAVVINLNGIKLTCVDCAIPIVVTNDKSVVCYDGVFEFKGTQSDAQAFPKSVNFDKCTFINCDHLPDNDKMVNCKIVKRHN